MDVQTAARLAALRKQKGLSQEELAERIGVSRQAVSKWERAESSPDTSNLIALSQVYGVKIDDMLNSDTPNAQSTTAESSGPSRGWRNFPFPVLITFVYVSIGIIWGLWHPGWLLFLLVPVWYGIAGVEDPKKAKREARKEEKRNQRRQRRTENGNNVWRG